MERAQREALRKCRTSIYERMNTNEVIPRLLQDKVLSCDDEATIVQMMPRSYERNKKLLHILIKKKPEAFHLFVAALYDTNQQNLAADLNKSLFEQQQQQRSFKVKIMNFFQPIRKFFARINAPMSHSSSIFDTGNSNSECSLKKSQNITFSKSCQSFSPIHDKSFFSWPSFCGQALFCVAPDKTVATVYHIDNSSFLLCDFTNGQRMSTFFLESNQLKQGAWHGIRMLRDKSVIQYQSSKQYIIALIFEDCTRKYCLSNIQIEIETTRVTLIDTHFLLVEEKEDAITFITEDDDNQLYCVFYWHKCTPYEMKTFFHIVKIIVDDYGKIHSEILAENRSEEGLWCRPFIAESMLCFQPLNRECNIINRVPIVAEERSQIDFVSSKTEGNFPPIGIWSPAYIYISEVFYYILREENNTGEVWAFNWKQLRWMKYLELHEHAVHGEAGVTSDGRLFLHGNCADEYCKGKAHLHHFGCFLSENEIFPTINQLSVIYSHSKTQIIHGPKRAGKSTAMLLKVLQSITEESDVIVFVSNDNLRHKYTSNIKIYDGSFDLNRIRIFEKCYPKIEDIPNDSTIFIDRLEFLTYETRNWIQQRVGKTIIVLDADIKSGLDQPRCDFLWHQLPALRTTDLLSELDSTEYYNAETLTKDPEVNETKGLKFQEFSMSMMDKFYPGYWSSSTDSDTVCIPACLDVDKNRYLGPSDCGSSNFESQTFSRKERQAAGQSAEDIFLKSFQRSKVGGILIFGFDTMEFAKVRMMQNLFKRRGISQIECDFIFIHPLLGVYVIELKATRQRLEERSVQFQKAIQVVNKIKQQIKILYEILTGQQFNLPIYGAVCFPFAKIGKFIRKSDVELIGDWHEDPCKLRKFFIDKMSRDLTENLEEEKLLGLKIFSCALAAYRSLEFISPVYNAMVIHKMISNQSFIKSQSNEFQEESRGTDPMNHTIFLTTEQLAIVDCKYQPQIISGPPGTGKTLLILIKALQAAKFQKPGKVRVINLNKTFRFKVQRFFQLNSHKLCRVPIIGFTLNDINPEDDLFIDEASFELETVILLKQRQLASGATTVAITGCLRPLQIIHIQEFLERQNLSSYRHFKLETVIRGSISIIETWKQEFPLDFALHIGHNISGPFVRREKLGTVEMVLKSLLKLVSQLLFTAAPSNICTITENTQSCEQIKSFLASNGIICGSLQEQMNDSKVLGVAKYSETLSFEWPIVVVVSLNCIDLHESFLLIAASRAIANLVIIERDYMAVQLKIDEHLKSQAENETEWSTLINYNTPSTMIINDTNIFDTHLAFIRHNYIPQDIRLIERFRTCINLFDCLLLITSNKILCQILITDSKIRDPLESSQKRNELEAGRLPKFVKFMLADLSEECKLQCDKIIEELVLKLQVANSGKSTLYFDGNYEKKMFNMITSNTGWMAVKSIISILLLAYL